MTKILVIDNYDSFVYTLVGYLRQLGAETDVVRNDALTVAELEKRVEHVDGVLISPGPGSPKEAGVSLAMVDIAARTGTPTFGVCMGLQSIAEAFGATVTHAEELMHGKTSRVTHHGSPLFAGVPKTFTATRYHSLAAVRDTVPAELEITAETESGIVMALEHREYPIAGVQYHPESVLTEGGYQQLGNWLESVGETGAAERAASMSPLMRSDQA